ncbi:protein kinase [Microcoleus sp. CAWBG640]|uniref:protein kinase domain-containing protein n=1 Tax=Microcoleus sp. CAWBG640 TaxID=2841653 RepID=UPI00312B53EA
MGKLVVLNIVDGDFENGFPVFLEIANDGDYRFAEADGKLPSAPQLLKHYEDWQKPYSSIVSSLRSSRISGTGYTPSSRISEAKTASQKLKSSLNNWLESPEMHSISKSISRNLKDDSEEIRVIIKTKIPELQRLPWHLWNDFFQHYRRAEVALSLPVQKKQRVNTREKTRILAVFGKTEAFGNTTKINTEKDWELLKQHLSDAELIRMVEPPLEELYEQLEEKSPDLFFFAGHSSSEDNSTRGLIELNQDEAITIDDLKPALRQAVEGGLQLAIFNSCDGLGIARELADLHIPQIIVMREPIPDVVAQKFLQRFLEAFVGERSVCLAVRRAREKIHSLEPKFPGVTWLPIVFQNPAELPLTGQDFRRIATGVNSNQANPIYEVPEVGDQSQILWLPTNVGNPYQGQQPPSTVVNKGSGFLITCSHGHQNPVGNRFCIHCGITLKEQETGNGNSSLPVEPPPVWSANMQCNKIIAPRNFGSIGIGGTLQGRYQIIKILGQGGFSETYLAQDLHLPGHPNCVIKKLKLPYENPEHLQTARRLFNTEAKILHQLGEHDQIPRLFAHFEENQEFYLVQEFIDGEDLSQEIIPGKLMIESYVIELLRDVLNLLEFVHQHNVIHRDIKPSNLIRRKPDGKLVLIDFGAAKEITNLAANTENQPMTVAIGTQGYYAPEQMRGQPRMNSDIYGLGMIGIQALTGFYPYNLPEDAATGEINWRTQTQVSPKLARILDKMVRSNFRERYQSATEVLQDLTSLRGTVLASPVPTQTPSTKKTYNRSVWTNISIRIYLMVALFVLSFLAGIALLTFAPKSLNPDRPSPPPTEDLP